jgi:hypothetical protein
MTTATLTAAFEKGFNTGKRHNGNDGIPASLPFKGSAETFYWAGFKKGRAELDVYLASPERAEFLERRAQSYRELSSMISRLAGDLRSI